MFFIKKIFRKIIFYINFFLTKDILGKLILECPWYFPEIILLEYLKKSHSTYTMFIVGAYRGDELKKIFRTKKISHITLFEPVPNNINILREKTKIYKDKTKIVESAVSDVDGKILFNETNILGGGSILKLSELAIQSYGSKQTDSFDVSTIKLDTYCRTFQVPDILWIDVQGHELNVLKGAFSIINKVSLIYIEVSIWEPIYVKGCVASEIKDFLKNFGFELIQLGTDFSNGTGNALFSKKKIMTLEYLKNKV
jgi:FkbM family methyltransferase